MQSNSEFEIGEAYCRHNDDDPDPPLDTICIAMPTALAHIFSEDGLVIAADGFNYMRTSEGRGLESDRAQKIYPLSGTNRAVSCSFLGRVTVWNETNEKVFSFISSCQKAAEAIASLWANDANEFTALICPLILEDLASLKRFGRLRKYPSPMPPQPGEPGRTIVRIFVDGYFNGQPYRSGIRVYHLNQELGWDRGLHELSRWKKNLFYGSVRVMDLLLRTEDPRLKRYRTAACRRVAARFQKPDTAISLDDAIEAARNFIEACSDPVAQEIDGESYQRIGGALHLATITPANGFEWAVRPEQFDPL